LQKDNAISNCLNAPLISVCIPVYDTEVYLAQCLYSVIEQGLADFEIVIVSDASQGQDEKGRSAKRIIRHVGKEANRYRKKRGLPPVDVRFIEHKENRGILEVRRTLVTEAKGKYIAYIDSDDDFLPGALSTFYNAAINNEADIVHATFISGHFDKDGKFIQSGKEKCSNIFYGIVEKRTIITSWLKGELSGNLCGKLIERQLIQRAFECIPYTECNMADDLLIFFFIALNAKKYIGLDKKLYRYRINSGMSSCRIINNLQRWHLVCSSSSVFAVISQWIKDNPNYFSAEELKTIKMKTVYYLRNALQQMHETVIPELQPQAREMLCEYWGESFVNRIEESLKDGK